MDVWVYGRVGVPLPLIYTPTRPYTHTPTHPIPMLLPYASDRPPRNPPLVVVSLVLFHFAVFGVVALSILTRGPDPAVVWYANLSLVPESLSWWAPLTYSVLHDGAFHLSSNM